MESLTCYYCGSTKGIEEFVKDKTKKGKHKKLCIECSRSITNEHRYPPAETGTKVCTCCNKEVPIINFYAKRDHKDGRDSWCKECNDEHRRNRKKHTR